MALVEAARYFTKFEASLAKARLDAADIPSFLFDTEMNWGGADLGVVPARLMVDDEDLEAARRVLEEEAIPPPVRGGGPDVAEGGGWWRGWHRVRRNPSTTR